MKPLAYPIDPVPSKEPQTNSFDIVVRDAHSVAVFWDLTQTIEPPHSGSRLCLRYTNAVGETDTLILPHNSGHVMVSLHGEGRWYRFTLGWQDTEDFNEIATASAELPPLVEQEPALSSESATHADFRASVFLPLTLPTVFRDEEEG
jgi:hypothetical protein